LNSPPPTNLNSQLSLAIALARNGEAARARSLLEQIVQQEPGHEIAWLALLDLLDDILEQIQVCERALNLNLGNSKLHTRLAQLKQEQRHRAFWARQQYYEAEKLAARGKRDAALALLLAINEKYRGDKKVWLLLSELAQTPADKLTALQNALRIDPNHKAARRLARLQYFAENPVDYAAMLEEYGDFDAARTLYLSAAAKAKSVTEWEQIQVRIVRLEARLAAGIRHVSPTRSILRMSLGYPMLYTVMLIFHGGLNPFRVSAPIGLGLLFVVLGGLLVAIAGVRSRHTIWSIIFGEPGGGGSPLARQMAGNVGWLLILIPFLLLLNDSVRRLAETSFPPIPVFP
jgi:tetratricopeptide (TPR) repeat protein